MKIAYVSQWNDSLKFFNATSTVVKNSDRLIRCLASVSNGINIPTPRPSIEELENKFYQKALDVEGILIDENIDAEPLWSKRTDWEDRTFDTISAACSSGRLVNKIVAFWHSVFVLDKSLFTYDYFRDDFSYVFIESYWPWTWRPLLWLFFGLNYQRFKKYGLQNKLVFGLGVNQGKTWRKAQADHWTRLPWSVTPKILTKQIDYIIKRCPDIGGIAFFVANIENVTFWKDMDEAARRILETEKC